MHGGVSGKPTESRSRQARPRGTSRSRRRGFPLGLLVALTLLFPATTPTGAAPASPGIGAPPSRLRDALARFVPTAQTSTDDDELQDLTIAPIDPSLSADRILRSRPFVLDAGAEAAFPLEATPTETLTEDEARERLRRFLELRELETSTIDEAIADYDSRRVQRIVSSPTLRASLLMLTGWDPYQAMIDAVLDGENPSGEPYRVVAFDDIGFSGAIATLYDDPRDGRHSMIIDTDYESDTPEQLIPVIVHESLHGGGENSAEEEIIANILDTVC